jgi:hypothetical protein
MMLMTIDAIVGIICSDCGEQHEVEVNESDFNDWQGGKLIQVAMPYLSADDRELLISGTCGTCFDKMFGDDE